MKSSDTASLRTPSYVLMIGSLSEGWRAYGPFASFEDADAYAQRFSDPAWIMTMEAST